MTNETKCKLCGKPKLEWQVFCGSACSVRWESGERPRARVIVDYGSDDDPRNIDTDPGRDDF